ncbi:MAG: hypothetical protein AB7F35_28760 [Acetobacteraceae bacterium]
MSHYQAYTVSPTGNYTLKASLTADSDHEAVESARRLLRYETRVVVWRGPILVETIWRDQPPHPAWMDWHAKAAMSVRRCVAAVASEPLLSHTLFN